MQQIRLTASWLTSLPERDRQTFLASLTHPEKAALEYRWAFWARDNQLPPDGDWSTWLLLAGRGFGKTRTGAELVRARIESGLWKRVALIAPTAADARDIMVEGESGLLAIAPRWNRPKYEPSKRRLTWANGAMATTYSADEPDRLRGPQHDGGWCDELAAWRYPLEAWANYQFGLRLGNHPQTVVTTTPRPIPILRQLMKAATTAITRGTTYDNLLNLAPSFATAIITAYEGTRLGRQELNAEILEDNPDALWKRDQLDILRVTKTPQMKRIVVGVDPPAKKTGGAEAGIVAAGLGVDGHGYVLSDNSRSGSPNEWASAAVALYHLQKADRIVAERNQGGDMVETIVRSVDETVSYKDVTATVSKRTRAEPIAALYEQGKIHHVGYFGTLEDQLTQWTPGADSPDRLDALVWALTELMLKPTTFVYGFT